jgi:hypothetical protein
MNKSTKGYNGTPKAIQRRKSVIERLEKQLKKGMRPPKIGEQTISDVPLMDSDIERIKKELSILKTRI